MPPENKGREWASERVLYKRETTEADSLLMAFDCIWGAYTHLPSLLCSCSLPFTLSSNLALHSTPLEQNVALSQARRLSKANVVSTARCAISWRSLWPYV